MRDGALLKQYIAAPYFSSYRPVDDYTATDSTWPDSDYGTLCDYAAELQAHTAAKEQGGFEEPRDMLGDDDYTLLYSRFDQ